MGLGLTRTEHEIVVIHGVVCYMSLGEKRLRNGLCVGTIQMNTTNN
jgi:hypothetical protein